jgi:transcriptional regulator with XRE-family HTH domain
MSRNTKHLYGILQKPKIEHLRLMRGPYSQAELATILSLNVSATQSWESGNSSPSPANLRALLGHYVAWTNKLGWPSLDLLLDADQPAPIPRHAERRPQAAPVEPLDTPTGGKD